MTPIFIFHILGISLSFGEVIMIVIASTLVSMGAPAIPSPGLVNYIAGNLSFCNVDEIEMRWDLFF